MSAGGFHHEKSKNVLYIAPKGVAVPNFLHSGVQV